MVRAKESSQSDVVALTRCPPLDFFPSEGLVNWFLLILLISAKFTQFQSICIEYFNYNAIVICCFCKKQILLQLIFFPIFYSVERQTSGSKHGGSEMRCPSTSEKETSSRAVRFAKPYIIRVYVEGGDAARESRNENRTVEKGISHKHQTAYHVVHSSAPRVMRVCHHGK